MVRTSRMRFLPINPRRFRTNTSALAFCVAALLLGCNMIGCTKPDVEPIIRVDTPPTPAGPLGTIAEFSVQDSLIGYRHGTIIKWLVTETNTKTVVTLNGIKVGVYGAIQSGQLTANTVFTLSVNNGKTSTKLVTVADSLTTCFWNEGKRWMYTDAATWGLIDSAGVLVPGWVSAFRNDFDRYRSFRISFYLDGSSKEEQLDSRYPQPKPSGTFIVYPPTLVDTILRIYWKKRPHVVDTLSEKSLVMHFDSTRAPGVIVNNKIALVPEH